MARSDRMRPIHPLASNARQGRNTASDELHRLCLSQFHGLASAWAELLLLARIIRMVENSDLAHARARVRYPLDRVLRKCGDSAFGVLAHSGEVQRSDSWLQAKYLKGNSRRRRPRHLPHVRARLLSSVVVLLELGERGRACSAAAVCALRESLGAPQR